jgi:SNF family Na+-dependent transporter
LEVDRVRATDLYIFLIFLNRDSHRFFIVPNLIELVRTTIHLTLAPTPRKGATMFDVILIALGLAFFALSIGYAYACDRL